MSRLIEASAEPVMLQRTKILAAFVPTPNPALPGFDGNMRLDEAGTHSAFRSLDQSLALTVAVIR